MDDYSSRILQLPQVKHVLELVGLTAITWNEIELTWYLIYTFLLGDLKRELIDRIYQNFATGTAKRDLAKHLAQISFKGRPKLLATLEWLYRETATLSVLRNAIVHADYRFDGLNGPPGLRVSPSNDHNKKPNRFAEVGPGLAEAIQEVIDKLDRHIIVLDDFRLHLVQNFPVIGQQKPIATELLAQMTADLQRTLPRELVAEIELPKPPQVNSRRVRRKAVRAGELDKKL